MMQKLLLPAILSVLVAACSGREPALTATPQPYVSIGRNVQVSAQNGGLAHGEELIAADPVNPRHLLACSSIWLLAARAFPHNGIREVAYVSSDGGASWNQTQLTHVGAFDLDPVCAIGFNGNAYFGGASAFDPSPGHDWLARSTNGGINWAAPEIFPWGDRDFIAIDTSRSAYRGRLYDVSLHAKRAPKGGLSSADIRLIRSTNNGATYLPSTLVFHNAQTHDENRPLEYYSGPLTILRNGHVVEVAYAWPDSATPKKIVVFVSTDGGASFSKARPVATRAGSSLIGSADFKEEGASVLPLIASDDSSGPFANRIYVAWQDFTKREYGTATYPAPQGAIMVAYSDDEGKTWSAPVEADDAPAWPARRYPEVFAPALAVNPQGILAVTWFDARGMPDGSGGALRMAVSNDGAESFGRSVNIASAPALLSPNTRRVTLEIGSAAGETHFIQDLRYHVFGQDTQGLAADAAGNFHPLWIDNRTGTAQLYTDSVAVRERALRHGAQALARLSDVSKSVGLEIVGGTYDRGTNEVSADALLWNKSKRSISGPLWLRITGLTSALGEPSIESQDNAATGVGAIVSFVPVRGRALAPKTATKPVRLRFHLADVHAITSDDVTEGSINYVSIAYRVYAP